MTSRKCPACGAEWYSADTFTNTWTCQKCGCGIPNEDSLHNEHNKQGGKKQMTIPIQTLECQVVHCPKRDYNVCLTYCNGIVPGRACEYYGGVSDDNEQLTCNYTIKQPCKDCPNGHSFKTYDVVIHGCPQSEIKLPATAILIGTVYLCHNPETQKLWTLSKYNWEVESPKWLCPLEKKN